MKAICVSLLILAASQAPASPQSSKHKKKEPRSVIEWTLPEFLKAMPELQGLQPAASQDRLADLLAATSQNVKAFFADLPNLSAHERIDMDLVGENEHLKEEFNYLAMPRAGAAAVALNEYRTNSGGHPAEPVAVEHGFVTKGFVAMVGHFHPAYLADSQFRYLGTQKMDGLQTDVVCFAQIPGKARMRESLRTDLRLLEVLVQGVAWIDSQSFHIIRMRTEKLEPYYDPDLRSETTESHFTELRFKGVPQPFWLPEEVTVTVDWKGVEFENRHHYSQYEVFRVDTEESRH